MNEGKKTCFATFCCRDSEGSSEIEGFSSSIGSTKCSRNALIASKVEHISDTAMFESEFHNAK
jgi:hypothetical protein